MVRLPVELEDLLLAAVGVAVQVFDVLVDQGWQLLEDVPGPGTVGSAPCS